MSGARSDHRFTVVVVCQDSDTVPLTGCKSRVPIRLAAVMFKFPRLITHNFADRRCNLPVTGPYSPYGSSVPWS